MRPTAFTILLVNLTLLARIGAVSAEQEISNSPDDAATEAEVILYIRSFTDVDWLQEAWPEGFEQLEKARYCEMCALEEFFINASMPKKGGIVKIVPWRLEVGKAESFRWYKDGKHAVVDDELCVPECGESIKLKIGNQVVNFPVGGACLVRISGSGQDYTFLVRQN